MIKTIILFILVFAVIYVLSVMTMDKIIYSKESTRLPAAIKIEETANKINEWISDAYSKINKN